MEKFGYGTMVTQVSLCEGPKPNISVICGFLNPKGPLFIHFIIQKFFKRTRNMETFLENTSFANMGIKKYGE